MARLFKLEAKIGKVTWTTLQQTIKNIWKKTISAPNCLKATCYFMSSPKTKQIDDDDIIGDRPSKKHLWPPPLVIWFV